MHTIDLRSDTFTRPSPAMREAIARAEVGDDVYREDPTVNRLELMGAAITDKEAALFVTSGSMGNLLALYINGGRGNEVLAHRNSHIIEHEIGSPAAIAGVLPIGLDSPRGILTADVIAPHLFTRDYAMADTGLIEVENTTNGTCYPLENLEEIAALGNMHNIPVHMDGARLMHAAVAGGHEPSDITRYSTTVSFCLSKGLGAPVGSILCGPQAFIDKARKVRKMLGGGMRQAGILAAAGIYALEHNVERLGDDHRHAGQIAEALAGTDWASINPKEVETNIIVFSTMGNNAEEIVSALGKQGILCLSIGPDAVRMVTHLDISDEDTETTCRIISKLEIID